MNSQLQAFSNEESAGEVNQSSHADNKETDEDTDGENEDDDEDEQDADNRFGTTSPYAGLIMSCQQFRLLPIEDQGIQGVDKPISFHLYRFDLSSAAAYTTLSYAWETKTLTTTISRQGPSVRLRTKRCRFSHQSTWPT
jgi:hypothetical protein